MANESIIFYSFFVVAENDNAKSLSNSQVKLIHLTTIDLYDSIKFEAFTYECEIQRREEANDWSMCVEKFIKSFTSAVKLTDDFYNLIKIYNICTRQIR